MEIRNLILCTDAPKNQGLAFYYYRALSDLLGEDKVILIDEEKRVYSGSVIHRGVRRVQSEFGQLSKEKANRVLDALVPGQINIVILFNNAGLKTKDIRRLAEHKNVYLINLLSDSPYGMIPVRQKEVFGTLSDFDLIIIFARALAPVLYQMGARNVIRIPFGYCKYTHLINEPLSQPDHPDKIYYFGTWAPTIETWLKPLLRYNLTIEGNGWMNASSPELRSIGTGRRPNTGHNMSMLARKADLVVNFTRAPHGCFHTMKTFELPVSGACVLSNYSDEQNEFFPDNDAMVYFNTQDEMVSKIDHLFKHPELICQLRERAMTTALPHSYHERAQLLLNYLSSVLV